MAFAFAFSASLSICAAPRWPLFSVHFALNPAQPERTDTLTASEGVMPAFIASAFTSSHAVGVNGNRFALRSVNQSFATCLSTPSATKALTSRAGNTSSPLGDL